MPRTEGNEGGDTGEPDRPALRDRLRRWLLHGEADARDLPLLFGAALLALPAALAFAFLVLAPLWQLLKGLASGAQVDDDALRNYSLILAAVLGAPFFVWRTIIANRQASTAEQGHALQERRTLTERFAQAVEMLGARSGAGDGAPVLEQRLGGIYALEKLAAESRAHHLQIMEVLCAYIRTNAPASEAVEWPGNVADRLRKADPDITDTDIEGHADFQRACNGCDFVVARLRDDLSGCVRDWAATVDGPREDIRAVLNVIGRRGGAQRAQEEAAGYRLDLRNTDLQNIAPTKRWFEKAMFDGAQLQVASLNKAQLKGAWLNNAQLQGAWLHDAQLQGAQLHRAQLQGARLHRAQLQGARLDRAQLQGVWMNEARLEGAKILGAQLQGTDLFGTQLQGASLLGAQLIGRAQSRMTLASTNLSALKNDCGALRYVDLRRAEFSEPPDLRNAFGDGSVEFPETIARPAHWPEDILDDAEFFGRWRGWVEAGPQPNIWRLIAPEGHRDVEAIPPDARHRWVER